MLDNRIDLTARRDFGSASFDLMDTMLSVDVDGDEMSTDQYEALVWWEGIFGRKRHPNQKRQIFNGEIKFYKKWRDTCQRCGKSIRSPWNNIGGVCRSCDKEMGDSIVPWKKEYASFRRDVARDLFTLR